MNDRKPILLVNDTLESRQVKDLLVANKIIFIEYDIKKFGGDCCAHLQTTQAPSIFAPEGAYKGKDAIEKYITNLRISKIKI
jgi:hypothetical protein